MTKQKRTFTQIIPHIWINYFGNWGTNVFVSFDRREKTAEEFQNICNSVGRRQ